MSSPISSLKQEEEIKKFSKDAPRWWDEDGPFAPLHKLNSVRLSYIKQQICTHFKRDYKSFTAFEGLRILDVGCGGGLVSEPLARLGGDVVGIDADPVAIDVAKDHAAQNQLSIDYHNQTLENINENFDVVIALEILEHVDNPQNFVKDCARVLKPGGLIIFSTLNRNPKSYLLGIVAAEYVLNWVPKGTHDWKNFIRPSELANFCRNAGLIPLDICGLAFNPINSEFKLARHDVDVNYFISVKKG